MADQHTVEYKWKGQTFQIKANAEFHEKLKDNAYANQYFEKFEVAYKNPINNLQAVRNEDPPLNTNGTGQGNVQQEFAAEENACQGNNSKSSQNDDEDATVNVWTASATKLLLDEYKKRVKRFRDPKVKKISLWREIEDVLKNKKFSFDVTTIQGKFRNMKQTYSKIKKNNSKKTTGAGRQSWPWKNEMDEIFHDDKSINFSSTDVISSMEDAAASLGEFSSPINLSFSTESSRNLNESIGETSEDTNVRNDCTTDTPAMSSSSPLQPGKHKNKRLYYQRQKQFDIDTVKLDILKNLGEKIDLAREVREKNALLQAQKTAELTNAINARTEVFKDISNHLKMLLDRATKNDNS